LVVLEIENRKWNDQKLEVEKIEAANAKKGEN
jgi:hypothetical protein